MQVMFSYSELSQKSPDDVHIDSIPRRFGPSSISSEWLFFCILGAEQPFPANCRLI